MSSLLRLESVATTEPQEIATIDGGFLTIGREPENIIVVDSQSLSRRHGCVLNAGTQWVYRDMGSTNGSWVNGVQVPAYHMRLLRDGDLLQLVNFPVRVSIALAPGAVPEICSIIFFFGERFDHEVYFHQVGDVFVAGGAGSDFCPPEVEFAERLFQITRKERGIELQVLGDHAGVLLNGAVVFGVSELGDRDLIEIGSYRIVVNDLTTANARAGQNVPGAGSSPKNIENYPVFNRFNRPEHARVKIDGGWESESGRRRIAQSRKLIFSENAPEEENLSDTRIMRAQTGVQVGFEVSPLHRFSGVQPSFEHPGARKEVRRSERLFLLVGIAVAIFLVLALAVLLLSDLM